MGHKNKLLHPAKAFSWDSFTSSESQALQELIKTMRVWIEGMVLEEFGIDKTRNNMSQPYFNKDMSLQT